jgi:hypothetical protein
MRLLALDLGTAVMNCTTEEITETFSGMLREMRAAAIFIREDERAALRQIMENASGTLTVADVFPDFARDSEAHNTLRRLRTAQFVLPAGRDMWSLNERIAIKPFAKLVWERLGEAAIFGSAPEKSFTQPEEEIDLSLPEVNAADSEETVRLQDKSAKTWDDDDVLDFLNESREKAG